MEPSPELPRRRVPRRGAETAERILDAAEDLFAERGFAGTTLRDVAARVGLRNPSLYNHFPSKASLYAAVLERGLRPVLEALQEFVADEDPGSPGAAQIERLMELLSRRPCLLRLMQHEALSGGERLTPILRGWVGPLLGQAQRLIEESPAAESWSPEEVPLLVLALYHVIVGYFTVAPLYQDFTGDDLLSADARARQTRFLKRFVAILFGRGEPAHAP